MAALEGQGAGMREGCIAFPASDHPQLSDPGTQDPERPLVGGFGMVRARVSPGRMNVCFLAQGTTGNCMQI